MLQSDLSARRCRLIFIVKGTASGGLAFIKKLGFDNFPLYADYNAQFTSALRLQTQPAVQAQPLNMRAV
jgi:hypothetical protein